MSNKEKEHKENIEPTPGQAGVEHDEWQLTEEGRNWYNEQQRELYLPV